MMSQKRLMTSANDFMRFTSRNFTTSRNDVIFFVTCETSRNDAVITRNCQLRLWKKFIRFTRCGIYDGLSLGISHVLSSSGGAKRTPPVDDASKKNLQLPWS